MNIREVYIDVMRDSILYNEKTFVPEILEILPSIDECISLGNEFLDTLDSIKDRLCEADDHQILTINQMITSCFDSFRDVVHIMSTRDFSYDSPALAFAAREIFRNVRDIFYLINNPDDIDRKFDFLCLKNIESSNASSKIVNACKKKFRYDYISKKQTKKNIIINRWIEKGDRDLWDQGYNTLKPETPINPEDIKVWIDRLSVTGHLNMFDPLFKKSEIVVKARNMTVFLKILYISYLILEFAYKLATDKVLRDNTNHFEKLKKWIDEFSATINKNSSDISQNRQ